MLVNAEQLVAGLAVIVMTPCTSEGASADVLHLTTIDRLALPDLGAAPQLGNSTWLNSDLPLLSRDLRRQAVALEMWTPGFIN